MTYSAAGVYTTTFTATDDDGAILLRNCKPGSYPNSIDLISKGVIPVAILTTEDFDATTVDFLSVKFGPDKANGPPDRRPASE